MWPKINTRYLALSAPFSSPAHKPGCPKGFVFFDAGSVILDLDWDGYFAAVALWFAQRNFDEAEFCRRFAESGIARSWSVGQLGASQYAFAVRNFLKKEFGISNADEIHADFIKAASSIVVGPMRPRVLRLISRLRKAGYVTGLLSNSNVWHEADMERQTPLAHHFDVVLFSQDLGCEKPEAEIYRLATGRAVDHVRKNFGSSLEIKNIFFVDDTPLNVLAARDAGWNAALVVLLKEEFLNKGLSDDELGEVSSHKRNLVFGDEAAERVESLFAALVK